MKRRAMLRNVGTVGASAALAGCGLLGGCGPGEDRISDLAAQGKTDTPTPEAESTATAEEVRVKGTIEWLTVGA